MQEFPVEPERSKTTTKAWSRLPSCLPPPGADSQTGKAQERLITIMAAFPVGVPGKRRRTGGKVLARPPWKAPADLALPPFPRKRATYAANGQREAHRVQHRGGDGAVVEGVPDAVVATEKAPLVGPHLTQVEGRQRQAPCGSGGGRGQRSATGAKTEKRAIEKKNNRKKTHQRWSSGD